MIACQKFIQVIAVIYALILQRIILTETINYSHLKIMKMKRRVMWKKERGLEKVCVKQSNDNKMYNETHSNC